MTSLAWTLTEEEERALRDALATIPAEQWPSEEARVTAEISLRLAAMERAECAED